MENTHSAADDEGCESSNILVAIIIFMPSTISSVRRELVNSGRSSFSMLMIHVNNSIFSEKNQGNGRA